MTSRRLCIRGLANFVLERIEAHDCRAWQHQKLVCPNSDMLALKSEDIDELRANNLPSTAHSNNMQYRAAQQPKLYHKHLQNNALDWLQLAHCVQQLNLLYL